jgi:hypothetical protein
MFPRYSVPAVILLLMTTMFCLPSATAQTAATCTFTMFSPPSGYSNGDFFANGINHYNTVVGIAYTGGQGTAAKAFIRYSGGGLTLFAVPNSYVTELKKRNVNGTSVGQYYKSGVVGFPGTGSHGLILTSSSYATLDYTGSNSTILSGINKSNVIVGNALDSNGASFGFKHSNNTFTTIKYPNAVQTTTTAINDNGVIVGGYEPGSFENPWSGYILQSGKFKTLSFIPSDINNSGVMVAGNEIFYTNGTAKTVTVPSSNQTHVNGINDLGTITGSAHFGGTPGTWKGFVATCH